MIEPTTLPDLMRAQLLNTLERQVTAEWQKASELSMTAEPKVAAAMQDPNQTAAQRALMPPVSQGSDTISSRKSAATMSDNGRLSLLPEVCLISSSRR